MFSFSGNSRQVTNSSVLVLAPPLPECPVMRTTPVLLSPCRIMVQPNAVLTLNVLLYGCGYCVGVVTVWVCLVIQLVSGLNSDVEGTLGGLRRAFVAAPKEEGVWSGLVLHPRSRILVLNSTPGLLQFFDTETRALSSEVCLWVVVLLTCC